MDGSDQRLRGPSLVLVFFLVLVFGHVQSGDVCQSGCKGAASTFKYLPGTTYKYNYDGKIVISLSSAPGETTSTEVKAEVLLSQLGDCNQLLRLNNVQIINANGKKVGTIPDIDKPIRVNFNDGELSDSICVVPGDNQNSINVKRAIASILQASVKSQYETDVFGRCPTQVTTQKEGNLKIIQKTRNLNKCAFRENIQQAYLTTAFNLNSEFKSSPLLKGDYQSVLKLKNGVVDQATVTENYLFIPFSVGQSGAKAQITSKLQLAGTSKESPQAPVSQPRSIIFEAPHPVVAPACSVHTIINAIKEVAKEVQQVVSDKTASQFINLLKVIRVSKKEDLLAAYNQVKSGVGVGDKDAAVRIYLDGLLRSGNGESVEALLELLKKNELNEEDSIIALFGLNVVNHATESSVASATQLLNNPKLPRQAYLGIGNLAGQFCRQHDCENNAGAKALLDKLASKLSTKITTKDQENDVIFSLKALKNVKFLTDNILQKLVAVAQNKNALNRVRVAALEAYTADACKAKLRDSALQILQDIQQDTEIRIKAYLAVARCPNAKAGNVIKALLEKEPSIQVGGFISSHVRSLQVSTNPDKALAKKFFNFTPKKRFHIDPRRYSFNSDVSYAVDSLGLGASSEANVIYSQNSWLPRSSSLNLTAQLFGHEINFLELETRQENLDKVIEHYLGPNGLLKNARRKEFATKTTSTFNTLKEYIDGKVKQTFQRTKRDVSKTELDAIAKKVLVKASELSKDLDVDFTLKTFGAELFFLNINQNTDSLTPEGFIDNAFEKLTQGLDKLKNFQETIRENVLLLDAQIDYPTSLGFPLRLAAEGAANIQVQLQGSIDLRKIISNPENGELSIKAVPSVNIEVTGRLSLDAFIIENGLKVITTLHSANGADIKLSWDKNTGFELKYGLPVNEQKLISVNHEIVFQTREPAKAEEKKLLKLSQVKDFSICVDQLSPFTGLSLCIELNGPTTDKNIPTLPFPLSGHAKLDVSIENDDASAFVLKHTYDKSRGSFVIDTINKSGGKKASLELQGEYAPEKYLRASATWPGESAVAELKYISNHVEHSLLAKYNYGKNEYLAKFGVSVSGSPQQKVFRPIIDVRTPSGQQVLPAKIEGQIVVQTSGNDVKYNFQNIKFTIEPQKQYEINGYVGKAGDSYSTDLKVASGQDSISVKGQIAKSGDEFTYDATVQNSVNPKANIHLKGKLKGQIQNFQSSLTLIHGPDLNAQDTILILKNSYASHYNTPQDYKLKTENSASYPLMKFNGKFDFEESPKNLEYDVRVEVGDIKVGTEFDLKIDEKTEGDYDLEFDIWGLENKLEVQSKRKVLLNDESKIYEKVVINGQKVELDGKVKHAILSHSLNVGGDLTLKISSQPSPYKISTSLKASREELDSFLKINCGSEAIIDAYLKARPGLDASGSIKLNIKDVLRVDGSLQSSKGSGKGDILIELPKGNVKVKADTVFHIILSERFDVSVTVYPHLIKNPQSKIFFSTKNQYSENHINSENKLDAFDTPIELILKASDSGDSQNGKDSGEIKLTVLDKCVILKGDSAVQTNKKLESGHAQVSFSYLNSKSDPGVTLTSKATWRDTDVEEGTIDGDLTFTFEDQKGLALTVQFALKGTSPGDKEIYTFTNKVIPRKYDPFTLIVSFNGNDDVATYEITSSYGAGNTAIVKGSYDTKSDTKLSGDFSTQIQTTLKSLRTLNIDLKVLLLTPDGKTKPTEFSGHTIILAQSESATIVNINTEGKFKVGEDEGTVTANLRLGSLEPIGISSNYKSEKNKDTGDLALTYGDRYLKLKGFFLDSPEAQLNLVSNLKAPVLDCQTIDLVLDAKCSKDCRKVISNVQVTTDGSRVHKSYAEIVQNEKQPLIDLKYTTPEGKLTELYFKASLISNTQYGGETRIINQERQFEFDGSLNALVENDNHIVVKGQVNCAALKWNKITFQGDLNRADNQRKIQITAKSANKNLLTGTVNYNTREENGKTIAEGSGSFKLKEETKSGNFKYISQELDKAKDGEKGQHISLNAVLGTEAIDAEFKVTDSRFRVETSYCEKKQDCVHFEIDNKMSTEDLEKIEQLLEVNVDLRKLGLPHEFGLKAETKANGWEIDHVVDVHFQNPANSKYQYTFALHPKESVLSLVTPKRIISLESQTQYLEKSFKGNLALYLDKKNHPTKKSLLTGNFDVSVKDTVSGDVRFTHPGLKKPLAASFKVIEVETDNTAKSDFTSELDIFAQENQKIVTIYRTSAELSKNVIRGSSFFRIYSKGLGIDGTWDLNVLANEKAFAYDEIYKYQIGKHNYEDGYGLKWNPKESSGYVKILNKNLIKFSNKVQATDKQQIIDSEISSVDNNPLVSRLEIKDYNTLSYSAWFKNTPSNKLNVNAGFILGQIADARAEHVEGGAKKSLFYGTIKLDEADFLKSDHKVDSAAIEHLLKKTQQRSSEYLDSLKEASKEVIELYKSETKTVQELLQKAQPNLNPLKQYYSKELAEFKEEIKSDKIVNELLQPVVKVLASLISAFDQLFEAVSKLVEESVKTLQATFAEVAEAIETKLIPALTDGLKALNNLFESAIKTATEIVFTVLGKFAQVIELSENELKGLGSTFSGLAQDLLRVAQKVARNAKEYIDGLPNKYNFKSFDDIKQQISTVLAETLPSGEATVTAIGEVFNTIKELIPPEFAARDDIVGILDTLLEFLLKVVKHEKIDEDAVIDKLISLFADLIEKTIQAVASLYTGLVSWIEGRSSILNYLTRDEAEDELEEIILDILQNPILIPPFPLFGMVVQGRHIFTFDGEQFTAPGSCNYLFARDAVNGNFSIAGSYKDGQLISITLADKTDQLTLLKGGQVKLGNAVQDLPVRKPKIAAYRNYEIVTLYSSAGATVACLPDLSGCSFTISGFYHSQVKGLLGNGNNEPFDDYTLPDGKVVTSESDFVNSYKLGNGCGDVVAEAALVSDNAACNKLFSSDSSLSDCYEFIPVDKFKSACARGLAAGVAGTEVALAKAYVAACQHRYIDVKVPENLVKCTNSDKPYSVGEKFSVKLPSKSADVVLILDTSKQNEGLNKLLQPLIQDLTKEFGSKGIKDVEYHLITYGGVHQWPTHFTVQGKMTFKGKLPPVKFAENPKDDTYPPLENEKLQSYVTAVKEILHDLSLATGMNLKTRTFDEAYKYPFRVTALKSIIVVNGEACEIGKFYPIQKIFAAIYQNPQISINLFSPVKSLGLKDSKKFKDIVGFNEKSVLTFSQGKKNPKGSSELHKEINYDDYCLEYVVNNRGNVFINDNYLSNKAEQKQFVHIAAVNIVEQLINVEQGLDCECKLVNAWNAANVCTEVLSKERPSKKV
ncbi:hypothetical protein GWI33_007437 [Rhynchophorus ferrugineus]|uniref:Apolipophorins n=2 Tax=Rhynchophorus ferrugineus TaxID=354439 RepID=A0A834IG98_RHYFE|nr:hypothetical protein GWI33_007437 [Rhynchophorus ferrugineus]